MMMECSYAVTAWTQAVEDEHRLLSQVLAVLFAFPELPADVLTAACSGLAAAASRSRRGSPRRKADGKADFWNAVGGQYKASLDYVVTTIASSPGARSSAARRCGRRRSRARLADGPRTITEMHRIGGTVAAQGRRAAGRRWIAIPTLGLLAAAGADGRFRFDRVPPGPPRIVVRARRRRGGQGAGRRARRPGSTWSLKCENEPNGQPDRLPERALALGRRPAKVGGMPVHEVRRRASCSAISSRSCVWACERCCRGRRRSDRSGGPAQRASSGRRRLRPDAVVLDLDNGRRTSSATACARHHRDDGRALGPRRGPDGGPRPGVDHPRRVSAPVLERLRSELSSKHVHRVEE